MKVSYQAEYINDLIKNSQLIIVAHVTNDQSKLAYGDVEFVITRLEVNSILNNTNFPEKEITLLQTVCEKDPTVAKDSTVLLFLEKYDGPVTDNAYVCTGLYQGQYELKGNTILPSKDGNNNLADDINNIGNLNSLKTKIDTLQ